MDSIDVIALLLIAGGMIGSGILSYELVVHPTPRQAARRAVRPRWIDSLSHKRYAAAATVFGLVLGINHFFGPALAAAFTGTT